MSTRAIAGSRVAVVGGSIAGCAAAIALSRVGCDVTVYERSSADLADRGFGIGLPLALHHELATEGYLDASTPYCELLERSWLVPGDGPGQIREVARQPFPIACENWAVLWRTLRARVPEDSYRIGVAVTAVDPGAPGEAGATVVTARGRDQFDLVVGADGYRSLIRRHVSPESELVPAGYAVWRGSFPERLAPAAAIRRLERALTFLSFERGQAGAYLIPDPANPAGRLVYCGLYLVPPRRLRSLTPLAPGAVDDDLMEYFGQAVAAHVPPWLAELIGMLGRDRLSVQPIFDATVTAYTRARLVLTGDAGAVARPHTASGATTALQDALALERCCRQVPTWEEALSRYGGERCATGNAQTELGRRLGDALVMHTPDWAAMRSEDFAAWWQEVLSGKRMLYD